MKHLIFACLLVLVAYSADAQAADRYVRKGASGSGTSWSDAWGDLNNVSWTGMSGYTLWIAAGSYTGVVPAISVDNITMKRATVSAHGSGTGWSDSYDGQVTVSPSVGSNFLSIYANNFVLDGAGYLPWKFRVVGVRGYNGQIQLNGTGTIIRGLELDGNAERTADGGPEDGFRGGGTDTIIEHSYIHDFRYFQGGAHNDGIQGMTGKNITIRYSIWKNNGMHIFLGDWEWNPNFYMNGINIHHNIFYNDSDVGTAGNSGGDSYNCIVFKGTNLGGAYTNRIENNVFNLRGGGMAFYLAVDGTGHNNPANSYLRNNIIYNSSPGGSWSSYAHSYNLYYGTTAPTETGRQTGNPLFTDVINNNYTLQSGSPAIGTGTDLGYTNDIIGNAVTNAPDMGAYQYGSIASTSTPSPPTLLRVQ